MWALFLAVGASVAEPIDLIRPVAIEGGWLSRCGDDPTWADPGLDDADWTVDADKVWSRQPHLAGCSVVWYRQEVPGVALREGQELGVAARVRGSWELFLDGERIAGDGTVGGRLARQFSAEVWTIPPPEGPFVLALRVGVHPRLDPIGGGVLAVGLGDPPALQAHWSARRDAARVRHIPALFAGLFALGLGLLHLGLHARRPGLHGVLPFGLGATCVGVFMAGGVLADDGVFAAPVWWRAAWLLSMGFGLGGLAYAVADMFGGSKGLARAVVVIFVARSLYMTAFAPAQAVFLAHTALMVGVAGLSMAWWIVRGIGREIPGARVLAGGVALYMTSPVCVVLGSAGLLPEGFRGDLVDAAATIAMLISMAWALSERIVVANDELDAAYRASLRFVPAEFLQRVGKRTFRDVQRGDAVRERMSILFLDVRGFTSLAEAHPPEFAFGLVNQLLDHVEPHVRAGGGFITSYTGDGFAALFGDADGAVAAAIGIQHTLDGLEADGVHEAPLRAGIGIHTGTVMLGTVGGRTYLTVSMVADAVNLAARVEGMTKTYGARVLVTSDTAAELRKPVAMREVDRVFVKGRREEVGLVQILDAEAADRTDGIGVVDFSEGRRLYTAGQFADAAAAFARCPNDAAAAHLMARCAALVAHPPADWAGIWRMEHK